MRAQVSLLFYDEDLYNNFIVPYKESKDLNGIIVRCLDAYYRNEQVRALVEGVTPSESSDDSQQVKNSSEIYSEVRKMLAVQSAMTSDLETTLADGVEDFTNILERVNKEAQESGFVKATESKFGSANYNIASLEDKLGTDSRDASTGNQSENGNAKLDLLWEFFTSSKEFKDFLSKRDSDSSADVEASAKTETLNAEPQVPSYVSASMNDFHEEEIADTKKLGEATDSMMALLKTI